jgi:hypothetical protein
MNRRRDTLRCLPATVLLALVAAPCTAHVPSVQECREGSDFIFHAAQARDAGASRAFFVDRLEADLIAIRAYPKTLRWFAQDAADEGLLVGAAQEVFDSPRKAELHRSAFLARCLKLTGAAAR